MILYWGGVEYCEFCDFQPLSVFMMIIKYKSYLTCYTSQCVLWNQLLSTETDRWFLMLKKSFVAKIWPKWPRFCPKIAFWQLSQLKLTGRTPTRRHPQPPPAVTGLVLYCRVDAIRIRQDIKPVFRDSHEKSGYNQNLSG